MDLLCCRNLLIYLTTDVQKKLIPLFHYSLNPGGILFQGSAETIGDFTNLFTPLVGKSRIFRRTESILRPEPVIFPASFSAGPLVGNEARLAATSRPPAFSRWRMVWFCNAMPRPPCSPMTQVTFFM